ncbi:MAG TPA: endonuclease/exonuclease/phosphatase family protein [Phycisphaerae bacterium]|nr:endonuclease/exonuclease/phosphatase family protein [Phycisphaerae bacterium]
MNVVEESSNTPPRGFWTRQLRPTPQERRRMRRRDTWVCVGAAGALLIFAYLWPPDWRNESPARVWISWAAFMIRVFQLHLGLLVLAVVLLAFFRKQRGPALLALPVLVVTLGPAVASWWPRAPVPAAEDPLTIVSCNLLMINRQTRAMGEQLRAADPDVIFFQEYTDAWHAALQAQLGDRYPHIAYVPREDSFGAAVYSRRPFVGRPTKYLPLADAQVPQIRAVIHVNGRDIALYNLHLRPPWGGRAYVVQHRREFADLLDRLAAEQLPAVGGGDFNFNETTPCAAALTASGFHDAQDEGGSGRGATWPELGLLRFAPGIRLDHLYLSPDIHCTRLRTLPSCGSDHRALDAQISVATSALR